jgi:phospholipid/cholesterol/gamma-HCH transport system ATP-binding protein
VVRLIRRLNDALGLTSIVVSHDIHELREVAEHSFLLGNGRVIAEGQHADLMASDEPLVRQFMHGDEDGPVPFHYPTDRDYPTDLLGGRDGR